MAAKSEYIYGYWPVIEALKANRRKMERLLLYDKADERGSIGEMLQIAATREVPVQRVPRQILDDLAGGGNHQNAILRTQPYAYVHVDDMLALAEKRGERPFLLLLDLLQDPQNVGSLMRVADAVGVHGIILQDRRAVGVTPAVCAASSGAVEHLHVAQVTNLVNAMRDLKERDVWMIGLDIGDDLLPIDKTKLDMAIGLVLGGEGDGLRRLVRETCDLLLTLPMRGRVASLNVATVGSVALYAAWQARGWTGWR
ncbi:MAG: 23S rRNA (guanosine(2251)-2'-O)-methyltransferase RlmB [Anaerolineaceae bacterium]|nr:MAG: 23S rRNA (guanosine(2251)-2'-O)-methyltransferase RlmB [Anaerolineaceae bacterium]